MPEIQGLEKKSNQPPSFASAERQLLHPEDLTPLVLGRTPHSSCPPPPSVRLSNGIIIAPSRR